MRILKRLVHTFDHTIEGMAVFAVALIVFVMLLVNSQVFMRYLFNRPIDWVLEIGEYSLLYIAFLGAAWLLREEGHVEMDLLASHLSPKIRSMVKIITSAIGIVICFVYTWFGATVTFQYFQTGYFITTPINPLKWPIMMIIPVACLMLTIQFLRRTYKYIGIWKTLLDKEQRK